MKAGDRISFDPGVPRPKTIWNNGCCFSDADLAPLLAKRDEDWTWDEYKTIFNVSRCAGSHDEVRYFLPLGLEYMRAFPDDAYEFIPEIVFFISREAEPLEVAGVLGHARVAILRVLREWTSEFKVVHFDTAACRAKEWILDHDDQVVNSGVVRELIDSLLRFGRHADLAHEFVAWLLADRRDEVRLAWFLEFARSNRESMASGFLNHVGTVNPRLLLDVVPIRKDASLQDLVTNEALLRELYQAISDTVIAREPSPTYWPDLRQELGV